MGRSHPALIVNVSLALFAGCASQPPLREAKSVDLDRYVGTW